jgi:hypothetical protein
VTALLVIALAPLGVVLASRVYEDDAGMMRIGLAAALVVVVAVLVFALAPQQ